MAVDAWATDFATPFEVDRLLEVRTSGMRKMPGLNIDTGIDKKICSKPMRIKKLGLEDDWHDLTFHGGPDKAMLGYCSSHYANWKASYPERADRFVPGGFGENFVTSHMNERNIRIGDVIAFGPENFAPVTYQTSRTGWYYRVVREGAVQAGDEIRLVERKWPQWTIERIQEYLHSDTENLEMNRQIAEIDVLGEESRASSGIESPGR